VKKPVKAKVPGPAKPAAGKAAQPGNRPGRGKAAHAKPAAKKPVHVSAKVKQARHATAVKAAKTRAANARKAKAHPRRQLALGSAVACCSAEALAASLRLSGHAVSDADVLALYWHTARDEHAGASIVATLEAAGEFGLAGVRPASFGLLPEARCYQPLDDARCDVVTDLIGGEVAVFDECLAGEPQAFDGAVPLTADGGVLSGRRMPGPEQLAHAGQRSPLILGLSLPAPHAVLDTGAEWMTWGEPWPAWAFPDAVIEEAWTIEWED
jgi:hypothetical protein